jgi:translation initiation factor 1A
MPSRNLRGGKAYKKGKKTGAESEHVKFVPRGPDQEYARILKLLGNRRLLCFCNDGKERTGKIRGSMCSGPQKQIIKVHDIVLVSFREFEQSDVCESDVCDIILKYEREHIRYIKSEKGIHKDLIAESGDNDNLFDRGEEGEGEGEGEGDDVALSSL